MGRATIGLLLACLPLIVCGQSWDFTAAQNKAEAMAMANSDATFALFMPIPSGLAASPSAEANALRLKEFENWAASMDLAFTASTQVSSSTPALWEAGSYRFCLLSPGQIILNMTSIPVLFPPQPLLPGAN